MSTTDQLAREAKNAALEHAKSGIRCAFNTTSETCAEVSRTEAEMNAAIDRLAAYRSSQVQVDDEAVAEVYRAHYGGRVGNIGFNTLRELRDLSKFEVGTKLYTRPAYRNAT